MSTCQDFLPFLVKSGLGAACLRERAGVNHSSSDLELILVEGAFHNLQALKLRSKQLRSKVSQVGKALAIL